MTEKHIKQGQLEDRKVQVIEPETRDKSIEMGLVVARLLPIASAQPRTPGA